MKPYKLDYTSPGLTTGIGLQSSSETRAKETGNMNELSCKAVSDSSQEDQERRLVAPAHSRASHLKNFPGENKARPCDTLSLTCEFCIQVHNKGAGLPVKGDQQVKETKEAHLRGTAGREK